MIALLTFYSPDFQPLADLTIPNKTRYCEKHGYGHFIHSGVYKNPKDYYAFDRLRMVYDLLFLRDDVDTLLVANLHTLIMNHNKRIEDIVDTDHDLFIANDIGGLNAGVFILKKSEWTKKWLEYILGKGDLHHGYVQFEQTIMGETINMPEFKDRIQIVPQNALNSYLHELYSIPINRDGQYHPGDWILHVPGRPVNTHGPIWEERIKVLSSDYVQSNIIY